MIKIWLVMAICVLSASAEGYLMVGDSMAEGLSQSAKNIVTKNGDRFDSMYKRGTQTAYWNNKSELIERIKKDNPEVVIIVLGTNDIVAQKSNAKIIESIQKLKLEIQSAGSKVERFVIVSPPIMSDNNLGLEMEKFFKNDTVINSKELGLKISGDKIHPVTSAYGFWANDIIGRVAEGD